ncbi:MAG: CBS domain-containing protein [Halolamina sp.]
MSDELVTVDPDTLVEDAADALRSNGVGSVLVVDDGGFVGILTTTDFVEIVAESRPKARTTVERYMSTDLVAVDPATPLAEAADPMVDRGLHHLPVVDDDEGLLGIVSTSDLASYLSRTDAPK